MLLSRWYLEWHPADSAIPNHHPIPVSSGLRNIANLEPMVAAKNKRAISKCINLGNKEQCIG
jgi:hypothetical protein